jgi:hypothetical protein
VPAPSTDIFIFPPFKSLKDSRSVIYKRKILSKTLLHFQLTLPLYAYITIKARICKEEIQTL